MKTAAQFTIIFSLLLVGCSEPTPEEKQRDLEEEILDKATTYFDAQLIDDADVLSYDNLKIDSTETLNSRILFHQENMDFILRANRQIDHAVEVKEEYSGLLDDFVEETVEKALKVNDSLLKIYDEMENTTDKDDLGTVAYFSMDITRKDGTVQKGLALRLLFDKERDLPKDWNFTKD